MANVPMNNSNLVPMDQGANVSMETSNLVPMGQATTPLRSELSPQQKYNAWEETRKSGRSTLGEFLKPKNAINSIFDFDYMNTRRKLPGITPSEIELQSLVDSGSISEQKMQEVLLHNGQASIKDNLIGAGTYVGAAVAFTGAGIALTFASPVVATAVTGTAIVGGIGLTGYMGYNAAKGIANPETRAETLGEVVPMATTILATGGMSLAKNAVVGLVKQRMATKLMSKTLAKISAEAADTQASLVLKATLQKQGFDTELAKTVNMGKVVTEKDVLVQLVKGRKLPTTLKVDFDSKQLTGLIQEATVAGKTFEKEAGPIMTSIKELTALAKLKAKLGDVPAATELTNRAVELSTEVGKMFRGVGATYNLAGKAMNLKSGYQTAATGLEIDLTNPTAVKQLNQVVKLAQELSEKIPDVSVGAWQSAPNKIWVEAGMWTKNRKEAITLGRNLNQQAIWDWSASEAVNVKGTGVSVVTNATEIADVYLKNASSHMVHNAREFANSPIVKQIVELKSPNRARELLRTDPVGNLNDQMIGNKLKLGASALGGQSWTMKTVAHLLGEEAKADYRGVLKIANRFEGLKAQLDNGHLDLTMRTIGPKFKVPVKGNLLSPQERIQLYGMLKDPRTKATVLRNGLATDNIKNYIDPKTGEALEFLSREEREFYSQTRGMLDKIFPELQKAVKELTGETLEAIPNYWPRSWIRNTGVPTSFSDDLLPHIMDVLNGKKGAGALAMGPTKERVEGLTGQLSLESVHNLERYYQNVSRIIAMGPHVKPILAKLKATLPAIETATNPAIAAQWQEHVINSLMGDQGRSIPLISDLSNTTYSVVLGAHPIKQTVVQLGSIFNTMAQTNPLATLAGIANAATPRGKTLKATTALWKEAMLDPIKADLKMGLGDGLGGPLSNAKRAGAWLNDRVMLKGMAMMDESMRGGSFMTGYDDYMSQAMKAGKKVTPELVEEAKIAGISLMEDTQSMAMNYFRMMIQKGDNAQIGKGWTMFQTQSGAVHNRNTRNMIDVLNGKMGKLDYTKEWMFNTVLPTMYQTVVDTTFKRGFGKTVTDLMDGNASPDLKEEFMGNLVQSSLQTVAILGSWANNMQFGRGRLGLSYLKPLEIAWDAGGTMLNPDKKLSEKLYKSLNLFTSLYMKTNLEVFSNTKEAATKIMKGNTQW